MPRKKKKRNGLGADGLSKYQRKVRGRDPETYVPGGGHYGSTKVITPHPQKMKQGYDFRDGFITTENSIRTGINFLPDPKAILVTPYSKEKDILYMLFRETNRQGIYLIKAFEENGENRGATYSHNIFEFLYGASWLTFQGKYELDAIKEVLGLREKDIVEYTGLELTLDWDTQPSNL
ncbi:hypothetical protein K8R30_05010 [archaeon]|nr:hypothetical protein [archaeon]